MVATIIYDDAVAQVESAPGETSELLLTSGELTRATGWEIKPEGICRDDVCVPLTGDTGASLIRRDSGETYLDLAGFARYNKQPYAQDESLAVWYFGAPQSEQERLLQLEAPDFTLPDPQGQLHTLSSFRGKKVFLTLWASW